MELPQCRWRGPPTVPEHHRCTSPRLQHGEDGVRDADCHECARTAVCDHEPSTDPAAGGVVRKAARLSAALFRHVLGGFGTVTAAEYNRRVEVCQTSGPGGRACPHWAPQAGGDPGCNRCGCHPLKWTLPTARCPLKPPRW